ncbi:MAG TPA: hypothetical protein VGL56_08345 [Fimbriimonadaceae bacterium]|jgi:hypothetical protein
MNEEPEEEWSQQDLPEGFDVFEYDAKRARSGQLLVTFIFLVALLMFILAMYFSYRDLQRWRAEHPTEAISRQR